MVAMQRQVGNMITAIIAIANQGSDIADFNSEGMFIGSLAQFEDCFGGIPRDFYQSYIENFAASMNCWVKFYDVPYGSETTLNEWCVQYPNNVL